MSTTPTHLSAHLTKIVDDVLTVGVGVAAALATATAILPHLNVPAGDIAAISVVDAAIVAVVKWLGRLGFKPRTA